MTYWTIMLITVLSGPLEGQQMALTYKTEAMCIEALSDVSNSLASSYDHKLKCMVSETPSSSIRPKARP